MNEETECVNVEEMDERVNEINILRDELIAIKPEMRAYGPNPEEYSERYLSDRGEAYNGK